VEEAVVHGSKSTIALLVVLAGLGAYIYFVESRRDPAAESANPRAFAELTADAIEEIEFKNTAGETSRVQRVGTDWQLVAPDKADADDGVVGTVTSNLSTLEVQRVVDENASDLAQYGLNPPRIDLSFRLKDQTDFRRLLVGEKTPTGGDVFAKLPNETRVFLISSFLDSIFTKTSFDLRDKAVLKFDRSQAQAVEIVSAGATTQFTGKESDWRVAQPISARADYAAVEGLMTRLSSTFMQRIEAKEATDLRQYGLDRPALTATVTSGSAKATLLIGRADGETRFAKDVARPEIFVVEETLFKELAKPIGEFRRKDLFDARSFTANRIEAVRGAETITLEKTTVDSKETWRNAAGQNVDLVKAEDFMTNLSRVRATSFDSASHPSLRTPVLTVTVRFDQTRSETVVFGRAGMDTFVGRTDEPGTARVEAAMLDDALKSLDALK
jgi:hypothetical protein